jgi:hypothetical protein
MLAMELTSSLEFSYAGLRLVAPVAEEHPEPHRCAGSFILQLVGYGGLPGTGRKAGNALRGFSVENQSSTHTDVASPFSLFWHVYESKEI